jgi:hypothetical protein
VPLEIERFMVWTKETALKELNNLIEQVTAVKRGTRFSAEHTRWMFRTRRILEEIFGRNSPYYAFFTAMEWQKTGTLVIPTGPQLPHPLVAMEQMHHAAYLEQLESTKGMLQEAASYLESADDISAVYQGKDTAPEASDIVRIIHLAEHQLRRTIRERPKGETEVQDALENLLIGADIDYKREKESIEYSSKTYIPDFTFPRLDLALDCKFCGTDIAEKRLIKEINDYIVAFRTKYGNIAFVVYDLGFIRDIDLFVGSFERHQNVIVRIVKH